MKRCIDGASAGTGYPFRRGSNGLALLGLALGVTDCGRDHDALARRPGGGADAGQGGTAGSSGRGGSGRGGTGAAGTAGSGSSTGGRYEEPPGRSVSTLLHGIVDAPQIVFCFARDAAEPELVGRPLPPGGLAYGTGFVFESLPLFDLESDGLLPYVIAGELDLVADLDCVEAVAAARAEMAAADPRPEDGGAGSGPGGAGGESGGTGAGGEGGALEPTTPRLRVASLPAFPPGALAEGYSSLFVALGCLGGPTFTHPLERDACGERYAPRAPTLDAALVVLSRATVEGKLSLQTLHASRAAGRRSLRAAPPATSVQGVVSIQPDLTLGSLRPVPPRADLAPSDYGIGIPTWRAEVAGDAGILFGEFWLSIVERAGLETLEPGRGYTLVILGPSSALQTDGFWNEPAVAVVDNDPQP